MEETYWTNDGKEVLFEDGEYDYEEGWSLMIFSLDGKLWIHKAGHVCETSEDWDETEEITDDEAIAIIEECLAESAVRESGGW